VCYLGLNQFSVCVLSNSNAYRRGRDRMVVEFTTIPLQSVPITT